MKAALAVALVLLTLGAAEASLRALDWPEFDACETTPDYAIPDPKLGFRGAPHGEVAGVRLNDHGRRGPALPADETAGRRRILFIGDSTCWGLGVALDESFAGRTARQFGADLLLGAFPGYSSYQSALVLEELLPLRPDVVVFYVGARNDGDRARYYPDADIPERRKRLDAAWHHVRLLRLVEAAVDLAYKNFVRNLRSRADRARVPPDAFRANVTAMLERTRAAGLPAVLVVPPLSAAFEADEPQSRLYREILQEVAHDAGVATVDVDARFAAREDEGDLWFEDQFHLSARGHAIVAEAIADTFAKHALLSSRSAR